MTSAEIGRLERRLEQQADEIAALRMRLKEVEYVATLWQIQIATESAKHRHSRLTELPKNPDGSIIKYD